MFRCTIQNKSPPNVNPVLTLWPTLNDCLHCLSDSRGNLYSFCNRKASIPMNELLMGQSERISLFPNFDRLKNATVAKLLQTMNAVK